MKLKFAVAALSVLLSAAVLAQEIGKTEDKVRWRQSAYQVMGWSMQRLKSNLDGTFNKDQVQQAANAIQAIANSGMGALFTPDTVKANGFHSTHVKPEFFSDPEGVKKVAIAFNQEANAMAKVAAAGDAAAVKTQFGKLGETCKACHKQYKKDDH